MIFSILLHIKGIFILGFNCIFFVNSFSQTLWLIHLFIEFFSKKITWQFTNANFKWFEVCFLHSFNIDPKLRCQILKLIERFFLFEWQCEIYRTFVEIMCAYFHPILGKEQIIFYYYVKKSPILQKCHQENQNLNLFWASF